MFFFYGSRTHARVARARARVLEESEMIYANKCRSWQTIYGLKPLQAPHAMTQFTLLDQIFE